MQAEFIEIKSALWQKIFASVVALPFVAAGLACCISPFAPLFRGPAPHPIIAIALGLFLGGFFFCFCWWPTMRYYIRADRDGISQFNGFFRQSAKWSQVESYYLDFNPRYHAQRRSHVEPILLNARGEIVFLGFAHVLKSTNQIIAQRRELWRFAEAQLVGKRVEKVPKMDAHNMAIRSFDVDWSKKSWGWKIVRIGALIIYVLVGIAVGFLPFYYVKLHNFRLGGVEAVLIPLGLYVPLIPHLIWIEIKKRRILRESENTEIDQ